MRASRLMAVSLMVLAVVAGSSPAGALDDEDSRSLPERIDLPRGWQPEGITTDGGSLYVGSLKNGALWKGSPRSSRGEVLAKGRKGRVAVGVDYDRSRDLLWVAGGATGVIRAHDARSGDVVATYRFGSGRFLNDLTVTRRGVYATDSMGDELAVVPLRRGDRLPRAGKARTLRLTGAFEPVPDAFNLNGVVHTGHWLLAVQSVNGKLFRVDPRTGRSRIVEVTGARLVNGDGLELDGDTLYVVRNQNNRVVALELGPGVTTAKRVARLTDPDLDVPATAAVAREALWAVNARFGTTPTAETEYWITRLPLAEGHR